jgi:hypothetical protein
MKKIIFSIIVLVVTSSMVAQRSEVGGFAGGSFYLGDLNPSGLFSQTQPAFGAVYRYNITSRWTVRANALWGTITADDVKNENNNPSRNLSFRSRINEFSVQAELSFLPYFTGSWHKYRFTPYLFGGVALFTFNPQAYFYDATALKGYWVDLAPLSTEGQGLSAYPDQKPYNTAQISLPFGLGFRYSLNSIFSIGLEWGMRKTFTDYLDDVSGAYVDPEVLRMEVGDMAAFFSDRSNTLNSVGSQRGNSNKTDWYSFAGITLTAKVGKGRQEPCSAYKQSAIERIKRVMGDF